VAVSVEQHAADVETLLAGRLAAAAAESETLAVSVEAMASSDAYLGRTLAADARSTVDLPPFDNSQMDGYAVRSAELSGATAQSPTVFRVADEIPAGRSPEPLKAGTAAPIMTGAPVPEGADAIIPIEQSRPPSFPIPGTDAFVSFASPVAAGTFVRARASDAVRGSVVLAAGTRLGAAQWGVLAASGLRNVEVRRRPRVLVVSTGLELGDPAGPLDAGRIYDANSASLAIAVRETGADVTVSSVHDDDPAALLRVLAERVADVDLVLTTGGVSAGAHEVVREALEPLGVAFRSVAMQPGGPQGLGVASIGGDRVPVVAFPGNPVSALVSFEMFLRQLLRVATGLVPAARATGRATLDSATDSPHGKRQVRRGRLTDGRLELVGGPSSHLLNAYARSNVLVHIPEEMTHLEAGAEVEYWRIDD
jgi:molybdopterin molybdotransferase